MKFKIILASVLCIFLGACSPSSSLDGTYTCDGMLKLKLEFKSNGSGYITARGAKSTFEYEIDGENLVMTGNGQTTVLTINGGNLEGDKMAIGICTKS